MIRYEVHQARGDHTGWFYWHKRSGNGEITSTSETFTRHEDAVRAIRTDVEDMAELLEISAESFRRLYAPHLTYFEAVSEVVDGQKMGRYDEHPLYPADEPAPLTPTVQGVPDAEGNVVHRRPGSGPVVQ